MFCKKKLTSEPENIKIVSTLKKELGTLVNNDN